MYPVELETTRFAEPKAISECSRDAVTSVFVIAGTGNHPRMSSFIPDGQQGFESDRIGQMVDATPEQVRDLKEAERLNRQRWHHRLAKFLRLGR
jgi:hypothetical protein